MADIVISVRAYCKMILHAMKYPHHSVNGVFLAEKKKSNDSSGSFVNIVDCIPLFHLSLGLAPMLEVALMQLDHYCKSSGLVIAGYYQANENFRDSSPDFIAYRIADKIAEYYSDACLIMIENHKLSLDFDDIAIQVYQSQDGKWKIKDKNCVHLENGRNALSAMSALLHTKEYRKLVDFDNHLDNISLDYTNKEVNEDIQRHL